jgi:NADP-dependent 3-hydroxy acid dehydrogenase YdfG
MALSIFGEPSTLFAGKRAVVSGGSTGIGRATAIQLARWGADVLIFGRHERELADAMTHLRLLGGRSIAVRADQALLADVSRVFDTVDAEFGQIDFMINNAAEPVSSFQKLTAEQIDYSMRANLTGYLTCTHQALGRMREGGHIVNVGSWSSEKRDPGGEPYVAAKAGIRAFSDTLRKSLRTRQIRVTLIEPGAVGSNFSEEQPAEQRELQKRGEMLKAEDIAAGIAFCLAQPGRCTVSTLQMLPLRED